ncbi:MAG: molybdate ABC transporter permease subunit [Alphaproteobacteria bacterium]|nr:molybdate ABC transporter permease subunit [Alphaproteobacteria bacterium]
MNRAWAFLWMLWAAFFAGPARAGGGDGTGPGTGGGNRDGRGGGAALDRAVTVFAASSLTDALEEAGRRYAAQTGEPEPTLVFGASSRIARQVIEGAPAHLVMTANPAWMQALVDAGAVPADTVVELLGNQLVVVVPGDGTAGPESFDALSSVGRLALAGPEVPAGSFAREALASAGILDALSPRIVSSPNVRATLSVVAAGEADAGIVYATDALIEPRVRVAFAIDSHLHTPVIYPLGLTTQGAADPRALAFAAWLRDGDGLAAFQAAGFTALDPPAPAADAPSAEAAAAPAEDVAVVIPDVIELDPRPPVLRSLWVASLSLVFSLPPAILLGGLMARRDFLGKSLLSTVLLSPLVLPPVVTGWLLLKLFGRNGPLGGILDTIGLEVAFSRWGAMVAAAVVGFPLLIVLTRQAIESVDARYAAVAETLGCTPLSAFVRVTLPMAVPGIAAGAVLAFARALGEFGATAMLAGDIPGETRTIAIAIYALTERPGGQDAAATLVWISLGLSLFALLGYEALSRRQRAWTQENR